MVSYNDDVSQVIIEWSLTGTFIYSIIGYGIDCLGMESLNSNPAGMNRAIPFLQE